MKFVTFGAIVLSTVLGAAAHEVRPAYLQIDQAGPQRYTVIWRTPLLSGAPLPVSRRRRRSAGGR